MRIYIAGFDVFRKDAVEYGISCKNLCASLGIGALYPMDNEAEDAANIFRGNLALIDACDAVCANLTPFRGDEPDSGTCFELGYAYAKGKKLYGYLSDPRALRDKLGETDGCGFAVENFGLPVNLMLGVPVKLVTGGFAACIRAAALDFGLIKEADGY